jgi:hypothetical protein
MPISRQGDGIGIDPVRWVCHERPHLSKATSGEAMTLEPFFDDFIDEAPLPIARAPRQDRFWR